MPEVPGSRVVHSARSLPNFDFIIARDDRAEFTSGANAVSATNVNDARQERIKLISYFSICAYGIVSLVHSLVYSSHYGTEKSISRSIVPDIIRD